jgi:DNA (cytosine-5)-methyltransferase 1
MAEGRLHKAPIHPDVKTLYLGSALKPNMLVGGFPCQDISCIGLQKGISGSERSSLFYEIVRLIDENPSIEYVFLENVANILKCGLQDVVDELSKRRGWNLQWTCRSASSVGAPHVRNRWFCLACKPGAQPINANINITIDTGNDGHLETRANSWYNNEPVPRVTIKPDAAACNNINDNSFDDNWVHRGHCLGNSVVPIVVRKAFLELCAFSQHWSTICKAFALYGTDVNDLVYPYPEAGLIFEGMFYETPLRKDRQGHTRDSVRVTLQLQGQSEPYVFTSLPTPRRGMTHASNLTERSMRDLPTVLVHSKEAIEYMHSLGLRTPTDTKWQSVAIANINYIEWMMGYEKDWTKISASMRSKPRVGNNMFGEGEENDIESDTIGSGEGNGNKETGSERGSVRGGSKLGVRKSTVCGVSVKKTSYNGMHVFMKENQGKDVKQVASLWKALATEERARYSDLAKRLRIREAPS